MGLEPRMAALQSPILGPLTTDSTQESSSHDDVLADDDMMTDAASGEAPGTFKQDALRRARGRPFWANFSDSSSSTPPSSFPPPQGQSQQQSMFPRHSSSGLSDMSLDDSPALTATTRTNSISTVGGQLSQAQSAQQQASQRQQQGGPQTPVPAGFSQQQPFPPHFTPPTAAEITRRINAKRRRGADTDDLLFTDPQGAGFKRRAVSPSMGAGGSGASSANRDSGQNGDRDRPSSRSSVANSPVLQSPMARDNGNGGASVPPWSSGSRSGSGAGTPLSGLGTAAGGAADAGPVTRGRRSLSVGGEGLGIVGLGVGHQDSSQQMQQARGGASGVTSRPPSEAGSVGGQAAASSQGRASGGGATAPVSAASGGNLKGRVGFMGMIETNDGLMRMSIE